MGNARRAVVLTCLFAAPGATAACFGQVEASRAIPAPPASSVDDASWSYASDGGGASPSPAVDASTSTSTAQPGAADGVCTVTKVSQGAFDPDCVYLLGMVGPDGPYALILPENPSDVAFGFGAVPHDWGLAIRPTDGVMLFESSPDDQTVDSLFRFVRTADPWTGPAAPLAVQAVVPTSCPTGRLGPLTVFPDGALLYSCLVNGDVPYRVQATTPASATPFDAAGFRVMATGKDESFFGLGGDAGTTAAIIKGGDVIPITGVDAGFFPYLARSRPDGGFLVAATQAPVYLGLFAIDPDGSVQMLGEYDFSGITPGAGGPGTSLEASGAVIVIASTADWQGGAVRRITTNKPPEVIYDPMKGPVGTQTRLLVTGP